MSPADQTSCFKHYCRLCHELAFVDVKLTPAPFPRCCGKPMAYLGTVDAAPGRDSTLKQIRDHSAATNTRGEIGEPS